MGGGLRSNGLGHGGGRHLRPVSGSISPVIHFKKKEVKTDRPYNTAVYLLRVCEAGIPISCLDFFEVGEILDILIEHGNDGEHYNTIASQEDMDRF